MPILRRVATDVEFDLCWPLLALAFGPPDDAKRRTWREMYLCSKDLCLYGAQEEGEALGVVGVRREGATVCEITHISIAPKYRRLGRGRALFAELRRLHPAVRFWIAETDDDAVGFYVALGFAVEDLGEIYPSVRRYLCTLAA